MRQEQESFASEASSLRPREGWESERSCQSPIRVREEWVGQVEPVDGLTLIGRALRREPDHASGTGLVELSQAVVKAALWLSAKASLMSAKSYFLTSLSNGNKPAS